MNIRLIIFDFDGTLGDTRHNIVLTMQQTMVELHLPVADEAACAATIGLPLEDCWLGGGVIVCPGVTIGDRCIIAAGSVVTHDIPSDSMAAGVPAEVKKSLK